MPAASKTVRADWKRTTLGEMFDIGSSKRVLKSQWKKSGVPFYRAREIVRLARDGVVDNDLFISEDHFQSLSNAGGVPQAGDLMVSAVGTLGACYEVREGDRFYYKDASVLLFRPRVELASRFMEYAFLSDDLLATVNSGQGATVGTFTIARARKTGFLLPPLVEQKRIVAILDQAFAALDRARAHAEANLADAGLLYESAVDALLQQHRPTWRTGTVGSLVGDVFTGPFGSLLHKSDYIEGGTPIVNPSNISNGRIEPDWTKTVAADAVGRLESYKLRTDDLVIGRRGEMGRCAPVLPEMDGWLCGTGSFIIRPKTGVSIEFVAYLMRTRTIVDRLSSISTGATMPNLSNRALAQMPFELPAHETQLELLERIKRLEVQTQALQTRFGAKVADIAALRQSLLQQAFSGQLSELHHD